MSSRGAARDLAVLERTEFEFMTVPALGAIATAAAKELLDRGLKPAEVCSLFTHTAAALARQSHGMTRREWLDLCVELSEDPLTPPPALSARPRLNLRASARRQGK